MSWFRLLIGLGLVVSAWGCKPKIGEDCATSTDCSIGGDRLCDVTQPGGYCTVFNCEPNLCPDDAACVAFSEGTCSASSVSIRFRRTFCMATCEDDSDCRGGSYRCIDVSHDEARRVVDVDPPTRHICAVPASLAPSGDASPEVPPLDPAICFPSDASFDVSRPEAGATTDASPDVPEASTSDRSSDRLDAPLVDREGGDTASDASDSSRVETGADTDSGADASDEQRETGSDAADETAVDVTVPDVTVPDVATPDVATPDADGQSGAGDASDGAPD